MQFNRVINITKKIIPITLISHQRFFFFWFSLRETDDTYSMQIAESSQFYFHIIQFYPTPTKDVSLGFSHLSGRQILNRQTIKALPPCELINLTSFVGRLYVRRAINVLRFNVSIQSSQDLQSDLIVSSSIDQLMVCTHHLWTFPAGLYTGRVPLQLTATRLIRWCHPHSNEDIEPLLIWAHAS